MSMQRSRNAKDEEREEIARQVRAFRKAGGKITRLPAGATAETVVISNRTRKSMGVSAQHAPEGVLDSGETRDA